jgi:hypothetical protein
MLVTVISDRKAVRMGTVCRVVNLQVEDDQAARAKMDALIQDMTTWGWIIEDLRDGASAPDLEDPSKEAAYWWEK